MSKVSPSFGLPTASASSAGVKPTSLASCGRSALPRSRAQVGRRCLRERGSLPAKNGSVSLSKSMRFRLISGTNVDIPVTFPPGRARLATTPSRTGSELLVSTMGTLVPAPLATSPPCAPHRTTTSGLSAMTCFNKIGHRPSRPSPQRYSMRRFLPSKYPSSRNPRKNCSSRPMGPGRLAT